MRRRDSPPPHRFNQTIRRASLFDARGWKLEAAATVEIGISVQDFYAAYDEMIVNMVMG